MDSRKTHQLLSLQRKMLWSALATASSLIGRLGVQIAAARLLGPGGAGRLAYLLWIAETAVLVLLQGAFNTLTRFLAHHRGAGEEQVASAVAARVARRVALFTLYLVIALSAIALIRLGALASLTIILTITYGGLYSLSLLFTAGLEGRQAFDRSARLNAAVATSLILCVGVGARVAGMSGALIGYVVASFAPATLGLLAALSRERTEALPQEVKRYAVYSSIAHIISAVTWSRAELYFLEKFIGDAAVAHFSAALTIAGIAIQGPQLLTGAMLAQFSGDVGSGDRRKIQETYTRATTAVALLSMPIATVGAVIAPDLVILLFGRPFAPAAHAAQILTAFAATSAASVASALVFAVGRSRFHAYNSFFGAVIAVALYTVLIPRFAVTGASWARVTMQAVMLVSLYAYVSRVLGYHTPARTLTRIISASIVAGAIAAAAHELAPVPLRLPLAVVSSCVAYGTALWALGVVSQGDVAKLLREVRSMT